MKIYFIGIGGASLSKLALIYKSFDYQVSGSDRTQTHITNLLKTKGIEVFYKHDKNNVIGSDLVVFSDAIKADNVELVEAKKLNIAVISRKEALNFVSGMFNKTLAICGCHGKTTTTALMQYALKKLKPLVHVGGELNPIPFKITTKNDLFVTEACEFKKNFLSLNPDYVVMQNIDADHLDCYKDFDEIKETFFDFAKKIPENGVLFANYDDSNVWQLSQKLKCKIFSFAIRENAMFNARDIVLNGNGIKFKLYKNGKFVRVIKSHLFGRHNIYNLLAACAVSEFFHLKRYAFYLSKFTGVKRRFEVMGKFNDNTVIHDYAHHPTEIKSVINAVKEHYNKRVVVVFEPHTYTRTLNLWEDFRESLTLADKSIVLKIYSAREKPITRVTSANLIKGLKNVVYGKDYEKTIELLKIEHDSIFLVLGAGSVVNLAEKLVQAEVK